jgi:hypothetical protein
VSASLLLPVTLLLLSFACCVEIARDVVLGRYGQAVAGLVWGGIFIIATIISAGPLLTLLGRAI